MKSTLLKTTMAALFATAFATGSFAQSATQPADQNATDGTVIVDPAAPATGMDNNKADMGNKAAMNDNAGGYLVQQSADQVSANTYIGQSVYNGENNSIGDVNDLIFNRDGGVVAAVIGVGGFLGIGEKNVAVPIDRITVSQNEQDGTVRLTTSETVAALEAAPEFQTLNMQASSMPVAPDTTATSSTTAK